MYFIRVINYPTCFIKEILEFIINTMKIKLVKLDFFLIYKEICKFINFQISVCDFTYIYTFNVDIKTNHFP